jgi:hypothetical protein
MQSGASTRAAKIDFFNLFQFSAGASRASTRNAFAFAFQGDLRHGKAAHGETMARRLFAAQRGA